MRTGTRRRILTATDRNRARQSGRMETEVANSPPPGISLEPDGVARCWWGADDELYRAYHDTEWGRPTDDDRRLFEKLALEGFMAGLSWLTILRKRESFRRAFASF